MRRIRTLLQCLRYVLLIAMMSGSHAWADLSMINFQSPIVEEHYESDPDSSLVRVSGIVKKRHITNGPLIAAEGVVVRFWQPDQPNRFFSTETNANGRYEIGLSAGAWLGEACGSGQAYTPSRWEALIGDSDLLSLEAVNHPSIKLNAVLPSYINRAGEEVTIQGDGFGCNGKLVFQYTNSVSLDGTVEPVSYHHRPFELSSFRSVTSNELKFNLPGLYQSDELKARHVAKVFYQRGIQRSNAIVLSQFLSNEISGASQVEGALGAGKEIYQSGNVDLIEPDSGIDDIGNERTHNEHIPNEQIQEDNVGDGVGVHGGSPLADQANEEPSESSSQTSSQSSEQVLSKPRVILRDGFKGGQL